MTMRTVAGPFRDTLMGGAFCFLRGHLQQGHSCDIMDARRDGGRRAAMERQGRIGQWRAQ